MLVKWDGNQWVDQHGRPAKVLAPFRCTYKGRTLICVMGGNKPNFVDTQTLKEFKINGLVKVDNHRPCAGCGDKKPRR